MSDYGRRNCIIILILSILMFSYYYQMKNAILILLFVLVTIGAPPKVNYPVRFTYINSINSWNSQADIIAGLGVPGYAKSHPYNYIALAFWSFSGPLDMAKVWDDPVKYIKPSPDLGSTKDQIQKSIKKRYNDAGISLFISAFGATQMPTSSDPVAVATSLATWVKGNNVDGVDIDYEDNDAMTLSTAEQWLITFQRKLRQLLPDHLITHAPQAPYFSTIQYRKGGYITVDKQVGATIDFYNIQFYNQGGTTYDSYETLFKRSNGWSTGTSVQEMINNGIPSHKIVVGKPATQADAANTGTVNTVDLGAWCLRANSQLKWYAGVMFWQYRNDPTGQLMTNAAGQLMKAVGTTTQPVISQNTTNLQSSNTTTPSANTTANTNTSNTTNTNSSTSNAPIVLPATGRISYPIRFTYVNFINGWWPASTIAAGMAVPGFAKSHTYNYVALAFWSYNGAVDIAKIWENPVMFMGAESSLGKTNQEIRASLKKAYNDNGVKVLVSAFGATEMPTSRDPVDVANKLAKFVTDYNLDGCDIDYEDNDAMEAGKGEAWLIAFTRRLRELLPTQIITHAPQAPYFKSEYYPKGGYVTVHREVGNLIDFYNVQFYNQGDTRYNSYDELFIKASGFFSGTSVKEIIARGIPSNKIVVGKPAAQIDVMNTGLVAITDLGAWTSRAFSELGWYAGLMFWQYRSDTDGSVIGTASANLVSQYAKGAPAANTNTTTSNTSALNTTKPATNTTTQNTTTTNTTLNSTKPPVTNTTTNTNTSTTNTTSNNSTVVLPATGRISYPIRFTYVNFINGWWPASTIAAGMAVPGFAKSHTYNYVALAFWSYNGAVDIAKIWENPVMFMGAESSLGKTNQEIRASLKKAYNDNGVKVLVSAFGATEMPTSRDPVDVANKLAKFVTDYDLDGCDIDYEDNDAMEAGKGEAWLIAFTRRLRELLPTQIITHAPQAPYFKSEYYPKGGYVTVHREVGNLIDFYNVQFYNQGDTRYNSYDELFIKASGFFSGTSVKEIIARGIPSNKIVVGKPAAQIDVMNTGLVAITDLGAWTSRAFSELGWYAGLMFWQYRSDTDGSVIGTASANLVSQYAKGAPAANTNTTTSNTSALNTTKPATNTTTQNTTTTNTTQNSTKPPVTNTTTTNTTTTNTTTLNSTKPPVTNTTTNTNTSTTNTTLPPSAPVAPTTSRVSYPVRLTYINFINVWWPATSIAAALGVPGYAKKHSYNYIVFAFWSDIGPLDIANIWFKPTYFLGTDSVFGTTDAQIRANLKKAYSSAGIKVLVSAFGATQMPTNKDPIGIANKLAKFVTDYDLDGCDIDYEDNDAMEAGKGEAWLIAFTRRLRELLPTQIITHAPQAPYFKNEYYQKGGYFTVNKEVGNLIDFYNVQFYNQGDTKYNTYEQLFIRSTGFFSNTSVKQIIARGIPSNKIVVGKPTAQIDVMNTGLVSLTDLGTWTTRAFKELGWYAGVMLWQYRSDLSGTGILAATQGLISAYLGSGLQATAPKLSAPEAVAGDKIIIPSSKVSYPVRFTWVNSLSSWWPADSLLTSLGVPGNAKQTLYNYYSYTYWSYELGATGSAAVWNDPVSYLGTQSGYGARKAQIQANILKRFHSLGIKVMVTAFGPFEQPTTRGINPLVCARKLAKFVISNNLDGVDINYEDDYAIASGNAELWLTVFSQQLRRLLPNSIISHSIKPSYFKTSDKGYNKVNKQVGSTIDFYNILYLQDSATAYNEYEEIFGSDNTEDRKTGSIQDISQLGVPLYKLVAGKAILRGDFSSSGWLKPEDLGQWGLKAFSNLGWYSGFAVWEYSSDKEGAGIISAAGQLVNKFKQWQQSNN